MKEPEGLRQKAYQGIKEKIINFELKPGQKILESEITRELGMGRTSVREALAMIESERLIRKSDGLGYVVTKLAEADIEDYFAVRAILEDFGMRLVIERITDEELKALMRHLEESRSAYEGDNFLEIMRSDTTFHNMLYNTAKSNVFAETVSSLSDKTILIRAIALHTPEGRTHSLRDHWSIVNAIEARNLEELRNIVHLHFKHAFENYRLMARLFS